LQNLGFCQDFSGRLLLALIKIEAMKKYRSQDLINELESDLRAVIMQATYLKAVDPGLLLQQPAPGKWSVIQVIEHLNSYDRYYLLAIERSLQQNRSSTEYFTPGWLGDYFTKLMKPGDNGKISRKMQSPKNHRPGQYLDAFPVINTFIDQQQYLLELLEKAREKNIGAIRTPVSISKLIRLKLGDTFRFLIAHKQRHFVQIDNTMVLLGNATGKYPSVLPAA
jgi:hypothetical protein